MSDIRVIPTADLTEMREAVKDENGRIKVLPADEWLTRFSWDEIRQFMHEEAIYVLPTVELLDKLWELIRGYFTIEIGAGTGNIGRNLGIKMTDSHIQETPEIKAIYRAMGQPTIKYPADVLKQDAVTAIRRFHPDCVLACYVTHKWEPGMSKGFSYGVDFPRLLESVRRLVFVGNPETHSENPIMKLPHETYHIGGLITRSDRRAANAIWVWQGGKS